MIDFRALPAKVAFLVKDFVDSGCEAHDSWELIFTITYFVFYTMQKTFIIIWIHSKTTSSVNYSRNMSLHYNMKVNY